MNRVCKVNAMTLGLLVNPLTNRAVGLWLVSTAILVLSRSFAHLDNPRNAQTTNQAAFHQGNLSRVC